jgi:hypothetical protein
MKNHKEISRPRLGTRDAAYRSNPYIILTDNKGTSKG